jgi:hypothetical protein
MDYRLRGGMDTCALRYTRLTRRAASNRRRNELRRTRTLDPTPALRSSQDQTFKTGIADIHNAEAKLVQLAHRETSESRC